MARATGRATEGDGNSFPQRFRPVVLGPLNNREHACYDGLLAERNDCGLA
jgi:hypothetical protein